ERGAVAGVRYHLGKRGAPASSAEHSNAWWPNCHAFSPHEYSRSGGVSPRRFASSSTVAAWMTAVISWRVAESPDRSANRERSTGGPATTRTVVRGSTFTNFLYGPSTLWAPQWAIGMTGAPVSIASRAAPVFPRMGHRSGSRVSVPSG